MSVDASDLQRNLAANRLALANVKAAGSAGLDDERVGNLPAKRDGKAGGAAARSRL